ncbi:hypothetical protein [Pauljensenia hongkongensis]|uniref:Uncharacterized protein n=1 Tax=Pauljensenia hongkongensis TaxID=178339 RepID=A0A1D8B0W9_9ACTO|nr:hypothetical protein [Pauljensenia hongkongensis]AOS46801.1 hypothetical protein BH719_02050 [Pauljensenia hongkongensis]EFW10595.1 hypothetical protein HMPREF9005_0435 [Actinomyces sp. oral taxon 178 str. F0338]
MEYNIIAGGPVGAADVEAVFGRWGRVCALGGGAVDVVIGDCGFVIAPEASSSVNPAFVRWVAHARGFGGSARVYSTEIDESYLESEGEETEVSRQVEAGLARLAERVGGAYAPFFQGDAISYTDPVGGEYDFAGGPSQWDRKRKPGSPALHLSWYGRPGPAAAPLEQWAAALERHLPQCCPLRRPGVEPVVGGGALCLRYGPPWGDVVLHEPGAGAVSDGAAGGGDCGRPGLYTLSCTVPVSAFERDDRPCLDELREFVALAAEDLGAEVATCELVYGYDCGSGVARPTRKASAKRVVVVDEAGRLLGLPAVTPWWAWLGPAYSGLLAEWFQAKAKNGASCLIKYPGFRGILISANGKAWRYERPNCYDWIPKEYMPRKRRFSKAWEPAPRIPHWDGE